MCLNKRDISSENDNVKSTEFFKLYVCFRRIHIDR